MAEQWQPILPLPLEVQAQIKSSITITSLNEVVIELLKNSLDARSQTITVDVDYLRGGCIVEDDGQGIPAAEFAKEGHLGSMHCKWPQWTEEYLTKYHIRHFQAPDRFQHIWLPWPLPVLPLRAVLAVDYFEPQIWHRRVFNVIPSVTSYCKISNGTKAPPESTKYAWHKGSCARPIWQAACSCQTSRYTFRVSR